MTQPVVNKLLIIWTSGDREIALNMVFMYGLNSRLQGWWDEVTLLVWGPSSMLLSQDSELQEHIRRMKEAGVRVTACKKCADNYGVADALKQIGVEVFYSGQFLTDCLKADQKILTF